MKSVLTDAEFAHGCGDSSNSAEIKSLPIMIESDGFDWWYQCSSPIFDVAAVNISHFHRRFDSLHAERWMKKKRGRVQVQTGQHKNTRVSVSTTITDRIMWFVNGDRDRIMTLLENCEHVGLRRGSGNGNVKRWDVSSGGESNDRAHFYRPLPVDFAKNNNVTGPVTHWGYRPNARDNRNRTACVMPC